MEEWTPAAFQHKLLLPTTLFSSTKDTDISFKNYRSLVISAEGKRKGTKERATVGTTSSHTLFDRLLRRQILHHH